jgi:hypothetical protein
VVTIIVHDYPQLSLFSNPKCLHCPYNKIDFLGCEYEVEEGEGRRHLIGRTLVGVLHTSWWTLISTYSVQLGVFGQFRSAKTLSKGAPSLTLIDGSMSQQIGLNWYLRHCCHTKFP